MISVRFLPLRNQRGPIEGLQCLTRDGRRRWSSELQRGSSRVVEQHSLRRLGQAVESVRPQLVHSLREESRGLNGITGFVCSHRGTGNFGLIFACCFSLLAVRRQYGHEGWLMDGERADKCWILQRQSHGQRATARPAHKMNRSRVE